MKKLFAVLVLFSLPLAPVCAQGLHGKILLLRYSLYGSSLQAALKANYASQVDSEYSLPTDLSGYDAILMVTPNRVDSGTISVSDQQRLIAYMKNGGKFYWEGYFFLTDFFRDTPQDTLARFLGLENEGVDALEFNFVNFFGVDSEFTNGFDVGHSYDPLNPDGGTDFPRGNFVTVLYGQENIDALNDAIAWIPTDTSIHALMHHSLYFEYYQPFLTRVLCDYFGLCTDAVHEAPLTEPAINVRVVYDGPRTDLQISDEAPSEVVVTNSLGAIVFRTTTQVGTSLVELPAQLPDGCYFARVRSDGGMKVQPFALFGK